MQRELDAVILFGRHSANSFILFHHWLVSIVYIFQINKKIDTIRFRKPNIFEMVKLNKLCMQKSAPEFSWCDSIIFVKKIWVIEFTD